MIQFPARQLRILATEGTAHPLADPAARALVLDEIEAGVAARRFLPDKHRNRCPMIRPPAKPPGWSEAAAWDATAEYYANLRLQYRRQRRGNGETVPIW
jgi:hypothetical protein